MMPGRRLVIALYLVLRHSNDLIHAGDNVGWLGFVPDITTHYGDLSFAGHTATHDFQLLSVFHDRRQGVVC